MSFTCEIEWAPDRKIPLLIEGEGDPVVFLGHGVSYDMNEELVAAVSAKLAGASMTCVRFNFPYRAEGRDFERNEEELMAAFQAAIDQFKDRPIILGGKSLGGRISSQLEPPGTLKGYMFLGYPLHSPGDDARVSQRRMGLLANLEAPALFIEGDQDPFCNLELLKPLLKSDQKLVTVVGADHSYFIEGETDEQRKATLDDIAKICLEWVKDVMD